MNEHLKAIESAVRAIRLAQLNADHAARNKNWYIIWKSVEDRNVADVNDVTGLFLGTYEEADALIERLNGADSSVKEGFGRKRWGYWRSEPTVITPTVEKEIIDSL